MSKANCLNPPLVDCVAESSAGPLPLNAMPVTEHRAAASFSKDKENAEVCKSAPIGQRRTTKQLYANICLHV
jgi:hypothetical protein